MLPKVSSSLFHREFGVGALENYPKQVSGLILNLFCDYLTAMIRCKLLIAACAKAKM